jgi:hemerythrin-like metal-binding protein
VVHPSSKPQKQIYWSDALSVGVKAIDDEHKVLLSVFNDLVGISEKSSPRLGAAALKELFAYTRYHFGHEEELMEKFDYGDIDKHRQEHLDFAAQVVRFESDAATGAMSYEAISDFIRTWIVRHVMVSDKALGRFLASRLGSIGSH